MAAIIQNKESSVNEVKKNLDTLRTTVETVDKKEFIIGIKMSIDMFPKIGILMEIKGDITGDIFSLKISFETGEIYYITGMVNQTDPTKVDLYHLN